jgi:hypothetical protein
MCALLFTVYNRANNGIVGRKNGYRKSEDAMREQYVEEIKMLKKGYNYQHISQITNTNKNTLTKLKKLFVEVSQLSLNIKTFYCGYFQLNNFFYAFFPLYLSIST